MGPQQPSKCGPPVISVCEAFPSKKGHSQASWLARRSQIENIASRARSYLIEQVESDQGRHPASTSASTCATVSFLTVNNEFIYVSSILPSFLSYFCNRYLRFHLTVDLLGSDREGREATEWLSRPSLCSLCMGFVWFFTNKEMGFLKFKVKATTETSFGCRLVCLHSLVL